MLNVRLVFFSLLISLTGCGAEESQDSLSIQDLYIIGTNDNNWDEIAEIDPYINQGEFVVAINSDQPSLGYQLNLYISSQPSIQGSKWIHSLDCDNYDEYCYNNDYLYLDCQFFPDMTGQCEGLPFNLSETIFTLPFNGYLIAEICQEIPHQCVAYSQPLVFW